ncbi:MAG: hypothetical protein ACC609_00275 [Methanobacterium formicicum]
MELIKSFSNNIDKYIAISAIVISLMLITILFIKKNYLYSTIGFFVVITSFIWLIKRKNLSLDIDLSDAHYSLNIIIKIIFIITFILTILTLYFRPVADERPFTFFLLAPIIIGILTFDIIISKSKYKHVALIQIIIVSIFLSSQSIISSGLIGIDPWIHFRFISDLINSGHIPLNFVYSYLPIYHLIVSTTCLITGLNYKLAVFFSITLSSIIIRTLFIYLLSLIITKNYRISLLSALFVNIGNYDISMNIWSIPNTLALTFAIPILFLIFKNKDKSYNNHDILVTFMYLFLMFVLILTHTLSSLILSIILFALLLLLYFYKFLYDKSNNTPTNNITKTLPIFFVVLMFSWWIYASGHIETLAGLIKWGFSVDHFAPTTISTFFLEYQKTVPFLELFINNLGMFLFYSVSFFGVLYMVSKKYGNSNSFVYAIVGLIPLFIGFFSNLSGLTVIEERWFYFSEALLALPLSITFIIMAKNLNKAFLISMIVAFLSFLLIISPIANQDNPDFSPNTHVKYSFTNSELSAKSFLFDNTKNPSNIITDYDFSTPISSTYGYNVNMRYRIFEYSLQIKNFTSYKNNENIIVLRQYIIDHPFRWSGSAYYKLNYNPKDVLENDYFNKVYDDSSVSMYK